MLGVEFSTLPDPWPGASGATRHNVLVDLFQTTKFKLQSALLHREGSSGLRPLGGIRSILTRRSRKSQLHFLEPNDGGEGAQRRPE